MSILSIVLMFDAFELMRAFAVDVTQHMLAKTSAKSVVILKNCKLIWILVHLLDLCHFLQLQNHKSVLEGLYNDWSFSQNWKLAVLWKCLSVYLYKRWIELLSGEKNLRRQIIANVIFGVIQQFFFNNTWTENVQFWLMVSYITHKCHSTTCWYC